MPTRSSTQRNIICSTSSSIFGRLTRNTVQNISSPLNTTVPSTATCQATAPSPPTGAMPNPCCWLPATSTTSRPTRKISVVTDPGPSASIIRIRVPTLSLPSLVSASISIRSTLPILLQVVMRPGSQPTP